MRRAVVAALLASAVLIPTAPAGATPGPSAVPEYWFDAWRLDTLWSAGVRGQGITIAEIDTGVNASLPELHGRVVAGTDLGRPGDGRIDRQRDPFGHGTAMASIMVGRPGLLDITGIAPDAKILPIAVPLEGTVDETAPDDLPRAIRYAADHGAKVISMSLGGKRTPSADSQPCPDDEQAAIYHALSRGSVVLAAVGNTGPAANTVEEPGACLGVVSVGAVDAAGTVAPFSGRQPYLTLTAPGVRVPSLGRIAGQAFSGDGTSQATAIASAVLALVWSRYPALSARGVVARLLATLDRHRSRIDPAYGYGRLDAYAAVVDSVPASAPDPVWDLAAPFMARASALAGVRLGPAPAPAGSPAGTVAGTYSVGSAARWTTPRIIGGSLAAALGLVLLLLLALGYRRRRRGADEAAPTDDPVTRGALTGDALTGDPVTRGAPLTREPADDRPRPRPSAALLDD